MNPFEVFGVVTGILGVWLTTRQKVSCWPVLIVSAVAFTVVFFTARLYAAMGLQVLYVGLAAYGWYAWLHGGSGHEPLRVSRVPARVAAALAVAGIGATAGLGWWLDTRTDQALPYVDAFATSFSLAAQWMQARKHLENWLVWIVVDLVYVWMVVARGLDLTAALYTVFIGLAVLGFRDWSRSMTAGVRA
jgi:nicotinamide mononucleotide transporter